MLLQFEISLGVNKQRKSHNIGLLDQPIYLVLRFLKYTNFVTDYAFPRPDFCVHKPNECVSALFTIPIFVWYTNMHAIYSDEDSQPWCVIHARIKRDSVTHFASSDCHATTASNLTHQHTHTVTIVSNNTNKTWNI